jgi:hypothetical protein
VRWASISVWACGTRSSSSCGEPARDGAVRPVRADGSADLGDRNGAVARCVREPGNYLPAAIQACATSTWTAGCTDPDVLTHESASRPYHGARRTAHEPRDSARMTSSGPGRLKE